MDFPQEGVAAPAGDEGEEIGSPRFDPLEPPAPPLAVGKAGKPVGDTAFARLGGPGGSQPRIDARQGDQVAKQIDDASRHLSPLGSGRCSHGETR
jgi:hypothetical protein